MWYSGWHTIIVLADNYWVPECTKITLLVITFSRSINKIPGDLEYFQVLQRPCI